MLRMLFRFIENDKSIIFSSIIMIFFSENHGLSQNDLVSYEPIGEQTLIWNNNNTVIPNGTILRVITNGSFSATSQFKLSPLINSTSDVGAGFSNVGNDLNLSGLLFLNSLGFPGAEVGPS